MNADRNRTAIRWAGKLGAERLKAGMKGNLCADAGSLKRLIKPKRAMPAQVHEPQKRTIPWVPPFLVSDYAWLGVETHSHVCLEGDS